ncbi:hypothetical protein X731_30130 [Mesorhizobium sp. L2C054A000]|nr:hypothetical protein [Mesorhizobium sp. L2C054A000]ESZ36600.1 hypothetical protein X731_30130 [Mesorhizobium sp. L2C054A000]
MSPVGVVGLAHQLRRVVLALKAAGYETLGKYLDRRQQQGQPGPEAEVQCEATDRLHLLGKDL